MIQVLSPGQTDSQVNALEMGGKTDSQVNASLQN